MRFTKTALCATLLVIGSSATAGEYTDRLSMCLTSSATPADKTALVRWAFSAIASHPDVSDISNITPVQRKRISSRAAFVFEKLIAEKCAKESRAAILNEGISGYQSAFETLGITATRGMISNPAVTSAMVGFSHYLDEEKIMKALMTGHTQGR